MFHSAQNNDHSAKNKKKKQKSRQSDAIKPPKKITKKYLHNAGLSYLQRFPASVGHFKNVMKRKITKSCNFHKEQKEEECLAILDEVTNNFKSLGLLDDSTYLRGMINSYRRRGLSQTQIIAKLSVKGLQKDDITDAIQSYDQDEYGKDCENTELKTALIFAQRKKIGPYDFTGKHPYDKALAILGRAGYSYDIAKKVLEYEID